MKNKILHDVILVLLLVIIIGTLFIFLRVPDETGERFVIYLNGEVYGEYTMNEDCRIDISDCCSVSVSNHKVCMLYSDCPNQICVLHSAISKPGEIICCVPNSVLIQIKGKSEYDFVI